MFASGANTQAGLNPVDVNLLNTFQQTVIYFFALTSNPITLHGCVVFLRIYWFEKRFQGWVREVRQRRRTLTKSKSKNVVDPARLEEGVNGRHITIVSPNGRSQRVTNDGILLDDNPSHRKQEDPASESSDTTAMAAETPCEETPGPSQPTSDSEDESVSASQSQTATSASEPTQVPQNEAEETHNGPTGITFADTVKRSDGVEDDAKAPQRRSNAEHIAILERQRNEDNNDILRIPGPRDAERGQIPKRLEELGDNDGDENAMARSRTADSRLHPGPSPWNQYRRGRQPTITIAEPAQRKKRDGIADEAKAIGGTIDALRFRKPRLFNRRQMQHHEDEDSPERPEPNRTRTLERIRSALNRETNKMDDMPYLSYTPTMARNSNFVGLTLEQREELGGIEYRSLRTLALVLLGYFWGFQLFALACLLPFILHQNYYGQIVEDFGVSRTWWGFWTANVAFMDVGFTLTPNSMMSFVTSEFVLMVMCVLIIIGNTGFPVMLRFIIWLLTKIIPKRSGLWEELKFLLDHPRRCFTLLFPSSANWWLFWILVLLNAVDLLFFIVLDLGEEPVADLPLHNRVVIGLFQAASTRTAGFSAVNLSELHPAMPVLYMIMMYISVFPIAISIRRTNVYEEKSLGVYDQSGDDENDNQAEATALSYVGTHLRRQLSFDLWFVFLGFFVLAISEGGQLQDKRFNLFDILFEVVSAYGTVGLSMGVAGVNASLCSQFSTVGKLVIVALQIRGRHRGLPYGLDKAVLLPSEARFKKEAEEAEANLMRTGTSATGATASGLQRLPSMGRGRTMSRDKNANIISKLLHPGPVVQRENLVTRQRSRSSDSRALSLDRKRTYTEPRGETNESYEENELEQLPSSTSSRFKPQRADTSPTPERSSPWR
jgi:potassium uptake Trk family protein